MLRVRYGPYGGGRNDGNCVGGDSASSGGTASRTGILVTGDGGGRLETRNSGKKKGGEGELLW